MRVQHRQHLRKTRRKPYTLQPLRLLILRVVDVRDLLAEGLGEDLCDLYSYV